MIAQKQSPERNPGGPRAQCLRHCSNLLAYVHPAFQCLAAIGLGALLWGCASEDDHRSAEYRQVYNRPLLSSGAQFAALPPAVQNTVRAEAGAADLDFVRKETNAGAIVYRISFQNRYLQPPLYVAPDGSLLDPQFHVVVEAAQNRTNVVTGQPLSGITLSDLPPAVVKAIQHHAPDAEVGTITKQVHGEQTSYVVTFKDHMRAELHIASDGTVLPAPSE